MLSAVKVEPLDFGLGRFNRSRDYSVFNRLVLWNSKRFHHIFYSRRTEYLHKFILQRHKKLRGARVSLPPGASSKLIINSARLMPLGSNDMQTADSADFFSFFWVGRGSA